MKNIRVLSRLMEGIRDARSRDLLVTAASNGVCKQQFSPILLTSLMQFRFVSFVLKSLNFATFPQVSTYHLYFFPQMRFEYRSQTTHQCKSFLEYCFYLRPQILSYVADANPGKCKR